MRSPDPVIVLGVPFIAWMLFIMFTALRNEPVIDRMLNFRAAVLQMEGKR